MGTVPCSLQKKLFVLFRGFFQNRSQKIITVDSYAYSNTTFSYLTYNKIVRPMYALEQNTELK